MPNYFSQLWTGDEFRSHRDGADGLPLRHAASNRFIERGVRPGDLLYVWSFVAGRLLLVGRMVVDAIASHQEAVRRLGTADFSDRLSEHAIARSSTEKRFERAVPLEIIRRLGFLSSDNEVSPPKFRSANEPDPQTFRGVRQLTLEAAALLDGIIEVTDRSPRTDQPITVTDESHREGGAAAQRCEFRLPDEIPSGTPYSEGSVRRVQVNRYERDPQARLACIEAHGSCCCICGFNFGAVYGPEAEGYIHVHHLRPLSEIAGEYEINPAEDLRPVCPNCHGVLHRRVPAFSIEEVRAFLAQARHSEPS